MLQPREWAPSPKTSSRPPTRNTRPRSSGAAWLGSLALGAVLLLWVAFAAWHLSAGEAFFQDTLAMLPVAAATLYDLYVRQTLASLAP
jgi:hypothetical protein